MLRFPALLAIVALAAVLPAPAEAQRLRGKQIVEAIDRPVVDALARSFDAETSELDGGRLLLSFPEGWKAVAEPTLCREGRCAALRLRATFRRPDRTAPTDFLRTAATFDRASAGANFVVLDSNRIAVERVLVATEGTSLANLRAEMLILRYEAARLARALYEKRVAEAP